MQREVIAERMLFAVDKNFQEIEIRVLVGKPYETDSKYGDWACPVALLGLHGVFPDMHGVDSWQSLQIAQNLVRGLLTYFVEDGGKLYWDKKDREEITIDELFGQPTEIPVSDGTLSGEQKHRVEQLTEDEVSIVDNTILKNSSDQWRKVARVVGESIIANRETIPDVPDIFYAQRLEKLVADGKLQSQGNLDYMRFSEIRLPS